MKRRSTYVRPGPRLDRLPLFLWRPLFLSTSWMLKRFPDSRILRATWRSL